MALSREYKEGVVYNNVKSICKLSEGEWSFIGFTCKDFTDEDLDIYYYNESNDIMSICSDIMQDLHEAYSDSQGCW